MQYYLVYRQFSEISDYPDKFKTCRCATKKRLSELLSQLDDDRNHHWDYEILLIVQGQMIDAEIQTKYAFHVADIDQVNEKF